MKLKDRWYHTNTTKERFCYLSIAINGKCQGNCIFCYVGGNRSGILKYETYKRIVKEAHEMGMEKIQITGGEPLLHPQFKQIIEFTSALGIEILVVTNGYALNEKMASFFAKKEVCVGLSFESIDKRLNNFLNGFNKAHELKMKAIDNLIESGYGNGCLNLDLIIKTFKITLHTMKETFNFAIERGITPVIDHLIPIPPVEKSWMAIGKDVELIFNALSEVTGIKHEIPFTGNEACNRMLNGLHVEVDGSVSICGGIQIPFYKINFDSPKGWVEKAWESKFRKFFVERNKNGLAEPCGSCPMRKKYECIGGCRAVPIFYSGKITDADPVCWRFQKKVERYGRV